VKPEEIKAAIRIHQAQIRSLNKELDQIKANCKHAFKPLTQKQLDDKWMSISAECTVCGQDFGWRCKESPDSVCHYESSNGKVALIDGSMVSIPFDHDPNYETDDSCIFCGHPDERK
jgi:hypothetical protein